MVEPIHQSAEWAMRATRRHVNLTAAVDGSSWMHRWFADVAPAPTQSSGVLLAVLFTALVIAIIVVIVVIVRRRKK